MKQQMKQSCIIPTFDFYQQPEGYSCIVCLYCSLYLSYLYCMYRTGGYGPVRYET